MAMTVITTFVTSRAPTRAKGEKRRSPWARRDELHPEQEPRDEEAGQHQADVEVGITHRRLNTRGIIHTTITALKKTMARAVKTPPRRSFVVMGAPAEGTPIAGVVDASPRPARR